MTFNDLLGWKEYRQGAVYENPDGDLMIEAVLLATPDICWVCSKSVPQETQLYRQAKTERHFHDTTVNGKRKLIKIVHTRWECRSCGKTFGEPLPHISQRRKLTMRAWEYIWRVFEKREFRDLGHELGADEDLVARAFRDRLAIEDAKYDPETPRVLGMDEIQAIRRQKLFGTLVNVEENTMYDLLRDTDKAVFEERFKRMRDRGRVEIVTMDQTPWYRDLIHRYFPHAVVIADKWHVLAACRRVFATIFSRERENLNRKMRVALWNDRALLLDKRWGELSDGEKLLVKSWTGNVKALGVAYAMKEAFFNIYRYQERQEAEDALDAWLRVVRSVPEMKLFATEVGDSVNRWREPYLNYFEYGRWTNALTEGLNSLIRAKQRQGRAYSYDVIRAVMIHRAGKRKLVRLDPEGDWRRVAESVSKNYHVGTDPGRAPEWMELYRPNAGWRDFGMPLSTVEQALTDLLP